ncbi:MAG: cytochrome P450 [Deinococcales bacterium]
MFLPPLIPKHELTHFGKDFLAALRYAQTNYGDLVRVPLGNNLFYLLSHPELAEEVLLKNKDSFSKLGSDGKKPGLQSILGQGILTNPDHEAWARQRQVLQPFFTAKHVEQLFELLKLTLSKGLKAWENQETLELYQSFLALGQHVIYQLLFSKDVPREPLSIPLGLAGRRSSHRKAALAHIHPSILEEISERKANQKGSDLLDLLDLLLEHYPEKHQENLLRDELMTIFAAGHETTASAITWLCYLLLKHPQTLEQVLSEISSQSLETASDLQKLSYLKAAFKESLRLYPAIPLAPRVALETCELAGYQIPKGARLFVSIYNIQRHRDFWPEAESFKPERFLQANKGPRQGYLPFGWGPRYCIGQQLAESQTLLSLYLILKTFDLSLLSHEVEAKVAISLYPQSAIRVALRAKHEREKPKDFDAFIPSGDK